MDQIPQVEIFLSRPSYPLGKSLVGTILLQHAPIPAFLKPKDGNASRPSLRSSLRSVVVYAAGFCRIDTRWHKASDYSKFYGDIHPFIQLLDFDKDLLSHGNSNDTVCFWATNGLDLLELKERKDNDDSKATKTTTTTSSSDQQQEEQLMFTFRVDIPDDLPFTINSTTCKYNYVLAILLKTKTKQKVIQKPFIVVTNPTTTPIKEYQDNNNNISTMIASSGRVKFGNCVGMAHSNGLPCHLSPTEIHRPKGQMTVALSSRRTDTQTIRVSNVRGKPVCVMTIVGATKLTPGSRVHLQWDFPPQGKPGWLPCYQVSACLMGEERAIYADGTTSRTKSIVFDTCHEWVDPGVTERVSKSLLLSLNAPCNLVTDVMKLSLTCQVDITVKKDTNNNYYNEQYDNLKMQLPCHVVHNLEKEVDLEEEENTVLPLSELLLLGNDNTNNGEETNEFSTEDIVPDLKNLSLQVEERLRK